MHDLSTRFNLTQDNFITNKKEAKLNPIFFTSPSQEEMSQQNLIGSFQKYISYPALIDKVTLNISPLSSFAGAKGLNISRSVT